jgi:anion transporter
MDNTGKLNTATELKVPAEFDPLDMSNYSVEKFRAAEKKDFEKWLMKAGIPLAIIAFILIYWFADISFISHLNPAIMKAAGAARLKELGNAEFARISYAMLGIFVAAVILWITEAIPNYLTSLIVILAMVLTRVTSEDAAYAQLGHPVMWLNILSFILASMLVATRVAKRFALWFVIRFGKNATRIFFSFIVINLVLSVFISATTAKATIMLPIFMVIAAIYGATRDHPNNAGRNIVLQNLFQITVGASGFITGSGANLLAGSIIAGALGKKIFGFQDWFIAAFPLCVILIVAGWFVGTRIVFPLRPAEKVPGIAGGMDRLKAEYALLGKMTTSEYKAIALFTIVLVLWATDKQHGISQTAVAFMGAVVALLPRIGVVTWNEVDIPWHLMIFSAGAYALGLGLDVTDIPAGIVDSLFRYFHITQATPFWILYLGLTFAMLFSSLLFQSKTMRALIFVPIAIGIAQRFGYPVMSLAFPVALLIEHVYVLPFNSKPAALLYATNQYSMMDGIKFGMTMMVLTWLLIILWGMTMLRWLGYTPQGVFF